MLWLGLNDENIIAQTKIMDNSIGRYFTFRDGKINSKGGIHPGPDICMAFSDVDLAKRLLMPSRRQMEQVNAMKNFRLTLEGPDELTWWFLETLSKMFTAGIDYGTDLGDNTKKFVNNSNAGAMFVHVKNGKIVRITPLEFDKYDAQSWTFEARGKEVFAGVEMYYFSVRPGN